MLNVTWALKNFVKNMFKH